MIRALLFLTAVALSQGAQKSLTAPHPDCPVYGHHLLPHEYDCTKFYYCDRGERFVNPTDCPENTEFSVVSQVCTHIGTSECNLPGTPPNKPTESIEDETTPNSLELLDNGCPADVHVNKLLPHETSCRKFYYCVHGEKVLTSCGVGTVFNPHIQVCDHPYNVDRTCEDETEEDQNVSSDEDNTNDGSDENDSGSQEDDNVSSNENNDSVSQENDNNNSADNDNDNSNEENDSNENDDGSGINEDDNDNENNDEDDDEELEVLPNGCPIEWSIGKYLPHEYYCSKSYQCVYGSIEEKACPVGTHFSYEVYVDVSVKKKKPFATLKICVTC